MPEEPMSICPIKDVWAYNLEDEFRMIRKLIVQYPFVAMVCITQITVFISKRLIFFFEGY